jgi:UDP-N-acetylglucosamine--N-acetylmuramyl-(pentapeptide) pyrophosphoryl-undecaprenol N-acetylglucosamine transferase
VRLAFAGGGTGGHLFPGLAVADLARARDDVEAILFFGAQRGIEARVVPARGYELVAQPLTGIRGGGVGGAVRGAARLAAAVGRARRELAARRIDVVVGLGGYASAAAVIGARMAGVPVVLLEQNRAPGISNRMLAHLAVAVCTSFEETARTLPAGRARLTGNPVRPEIEALGDRLAAAPATEHLRTRTSLLVFGGSAGAVSLNRAVVAALARLSARAPLPPVLHQTGSRSLDEVRAAYREAGITADVREFIDDMAGAYGTARLAVCRSGATTVAELCATGTPAVFVPFPFAAGDHQTGNARALEQAGAALLIPDDAETPARLEDALGRLLGDAEKLNSMARSAAELRKPGAAARVLDVVISAARARKRGQVS